MQACKRMMAMLLALVMALSVIPVNTFAAEPQPAPEADVNESAQIREAQYPDRKCTVIGKDGTVNGLPADTRLTGDTVTTNATAEGTCGENLTWSVSDGVLTISGQGTMDHFEHDERSLPWSEYIREITAVVVEEGVTSLGQCAFAHMVKVKSISLPATLTEIGTRAFYFMPDLETITVAEDNPAFTSVDGILFTKDMTTLFRYPANRPGTSYTIPGTVTRLGSNSMAHCDNLQELVIPEGVKYIEAEACFNMNGLTTIHLPASLEVMGSDAFDACYGLTAFTVAQNNQYFRAIDGILYNKAGTDLLLCPVQKGGDVVLPEGVEQISSYAFSECEITTLTIPSTVMWIGPWAMNNCHAAQYFVAEGNPTFADLDGVLFNKDLTVLIKYPKVRSGAYTVPDSVIQILGYAFYTVDELTALTLQEGLCGISTDAFLYCYQLSEIVLPESVGTVGAYAFEGCDNLSRITFRNPYCNIDPRNIGGSVDMVMVGYADSTAQAYAEANGRTFESLGTHNVGKGGKIGSSLYWSLDDAGVMRISGTGGMPVSHYDIDFPWETCRDQVKKVILEEGITSLSARAFYDYDNLVEVTLPDTLTNIGEDVFAYSYGLEAIHVDAGNPRYSSQNGVLFSDKQTVLEIYPAARAESFYLVPASVTHIRKHAFQAVQYLGNIQFQDDAPAFGEESFLYSSVVVSYPTGNNSWTQNVQKNYGGTVYWYPDSADLAFVRQPGLKNQTEPATHILYALAAGDRPFYQWQYRKSADAAWMDCENQNFKGISVEVNEETLGWEYRCKATDPDGNTVYSDVVTLEFSLPDKLENLLYGAYTLDRLVLGADGIYRTPDGRKVYIAVHNVEDGGIAYWLAGNTLYDYVAAYGDEYFDMTHWEDLMALMDEDGYVVLTEESLGYLRSVTTGNPNWAEEDGTYLHCYLFYDKDVVIETVDTGWSGATQWTLTSDGVMTVYGTGNMKDYGWSGGQPWAKYVAQITSVVIEEGVARIGSGAFKDMTALESVTLPATGLNKIGIAAFYGCTSLKEITIPEGIYTIWEYTFKNCSGMESVNLPKTLIKIDQGAFEACTSLAELYLPTNVNIIGGWSFKGCTAMTRVDMQWADAKEIRPGAFKNCTALTEIILPTNIQTLGDSCFYGIGATSFTVPDTVTTIEDWCFARSSLKEIIFEGNAPAIGTGAFNKITLTARYPSGNATWTAEIMQNYGGTVTWEAN